MMLPERIDEALDGEAGELSSEPWASAIRLAAGTIQALKRSDVEQLESLARSAGVLQARSICPSAAQLQSLHQGMQLLESVLKETRRNLHVLTICTGRSGEIEYRPGQRIWAD